MKRILLILTLCLLLVGCGLFSPPTTTTTTTTEDVRHIAIREFLLETTQRFGAPEDTDLVYDPTYSPTIYGAADLVMWTRDDSINLLASKDTRMALIELVLDVQESSFSTDVWNIMITYSDSERELYVYLNFYFYGRLFIEDYAPITVERRQQVWVQELELLTLEDIEWIVAQLGYDVEYTGGIAL